MELQNVYGELQDLGFSLIGVSGDAAENLRGTVRGESLDFAVLRDPKLAAAERFGIVYELDAETAESFAEGGIHLPDARLPVPAVFLIDRSGKIRFQYADPDYRIRLSGRELLEAARRLASESDGDAGLRGFDLKRGD